MWSVAPMSLAIDAWIALMVYWLISAWNLKRIRYVAPLSVRITQLLFLVPGAMLLFGSRYRVGLLHLALLPQTAVVAMIGVAVTFAGIALAIWARYCLGSNWSGQVAIRENHELIQSGPYRRIRHPIYTGIIVAGWGTAIVTRELGACFGVILITLGFAYKGKQEELHLHATFGEAFTAHRERTGMFLPKMR